MHISFKENILTGNVIKATMIYFHALLLPPTVLFQEICVLKP